MPLCGGGAPHGDTRGAWDMGRDCRAEALTITFIYLRKTFCFRTKLKGCVKWQHNEHSFASDFFGSRACPFVARATALRLPTLLPRGLFPAAWPRGPPPPAERT